MKWWHWVLIVLGLAIPVAVYFLFFRNGGVSAATTTAAAQTAPAETAPPTAQPPPAVASALATVNGAVQATQGVLGTINSIGALTGSLGLGN
jgi:hypothetical protein